jgi:Toprim domain
MSALRDYARRLGGDCAGDQVLCPGPGHGPRDRSLSVRLSATAPDGFIAFSHAGDDWRECRDYVRDRLGWKRRGDRNPLAPKAAKVGKGDPEYERRQHEKAAWLWAQRQPLEGSIGEIYLRQARGYAGPLPATLGFLKQQKPEHSPALIAAFALPQESEPCVLAAPKEVGAALLIALKPDGSGKADVEHPKKTIGSPAGLPIAVAPVNDLLGLAITEGLEDALSVAEATGLGVWAAGGASFMPKLAAAVPSYVECVTIFAHADQAGRKGARDLERLLLNRGIEVRLDEGGA